MSSQVMAYEEKDVLFAGALARLFLFGKMIEVIPGLSIAIKPSHQKESSYASSSLPSPQYRVEAKH